MTTPQRILLRRTKGWRKPTGAIVVSRPTRWGNPHRADELGRAAAVARYRADLYAGRLSFDVADVVRELAGHDLACWCPLDQPCHADVLLDVLVDTTTVQSAGSPIAADD